MSGIETTTDHALAAAEHLRHVAPGFQPYPLFVEKSRLFGGITVELVALRYAEPQIGENLQALLIQRPEDDEFWQGRWHIAGSNIWGSEEFTDYHDYHQPLRRLLDVELQGSLTPIDGPYEFGTQTRNSPRGLEISIVHYAFMIGEPAVGKFFDVDMLLTSPPVDVLDEHLESIGHVVQKLKKLT